MSEIAETFFGRIPAVGGRIIENSQPDIIEPVIL
jgi:hypothetical protein